MIDQLVDSSGMSVPLHPIPPQSHLVPAPPAGELLALPLDMWSIAQEAYTLKYATPMWDMSKWNDELARKKLENPDVIIYCGDQVYHAHTERLQKASNILGAACQAPGAVGPIEVHLHNDRPEAIGILLREIYSCWSWKLAAKLYVEANKMEPRNEAFLWAAAHAVAVKYNMERLETLAVEHFRIWGEKAVFFNIEEFARVVKLLWEQEEFQSFNKIIEEVLEYGMYQSFWLETDTRFQLTKIGIVSDKFTTRHIASFGRKWERLKYFQSKLSPTQRAAWEVGEVQRMESFQETKVRDHSTRSGGAEGIRTRGLKRGLKRRGHDDIVTDGGDGKRADKRGRECDEDDFTMY